MNFGQETPCSSVLAAENVNYPEPRKDYDYMGCCLLGTFMNGP